MSDENAKEITAEDVAGLQKALEAGPLPEGAAVDPFQGGDKEISTAGPLYSDPPLTPEAEQAIGEAAPEPQVSPEDRAAIKAREAAVRRDTDSATQVPLRPSFAAKTSRDGKVTYGENQMRFAEALTGHSGPRAVEILIELTTTFFGDAQKVIDAVPAELPDWAR